ncbi:hypothetical protein CLI64_17950 [Nostoc sp. CENA543]|uniref:hypothetical protein n=1 Tax=Nostoc sp. CENA543 TaxID=1869241 RepID=UPI000CA26899|nr:hypothetical protein [Nostoc sp. CENA543]AUT02115.1 hypothetical protein CLI64_17950 [Nostoc sp. CENA543]
MQIDSVFLDEKLHPLVDGVFGVIPIQNNLLLNPSDMLLHETLRVNVSETEAKATQLSKPDFIRVSGFISVSKF